MERKNSSNMLELRLYVSAEYVCAAAFENCQMKNTRMITGDTVQTQMGTRHSFVKIRMEMRSIELHFHVNC